ncbi:cyclic AMP-dependent transcription factor ATF-6 alpha isoform 1-T1 [Synchiropus picturatus]
MSTDLMLDLENQHYPMMDVEERFEHLNQGGDWDIPGFDLDDATEWIDAFQNAGYACDGPELDFDLDLPLWNDVNTSSIYTDGEMSVGSLSPAHTFSSAPSPGSMGSFSPHSVQDEALSPQSQPSPVSVCSDLSGISEVTLPVKKSPRKISQTSRAVKPALPLKRPIHCGPKVCIQPKPVIAAVPVAAAPLQAKTIIIQPVQTNLVPVIKPTPINIQPAPPQGHPIVLSQPSQLLQISTPQTVTGNVVTIPTLERPVSVAAPPLVPVTLKASSDDDSKFSQRQQRMIKNRESASLSRKKKKDYLFSLEARLKMALSENEVLKSENGNLKKQLEGLLSENTALKATSPKRRAVCLMVILVFVFLNVGPLSSRFQDSSGLEVVSVQHSRHLLGFSPDDAIERSTEPLGAGPTMAADSSEDKALMVMKDPVFIRPPPPCQPPVNRTKCIELAHELRGWVHRHEVQQTKSRRMSNRNHKPTRTILKTPAKDAGSGHIMTVHYTEPTEDRLPGSELQVYYAPRNTYSDFFDEINRRGDTFYVVSFRRDHLLLPATHHNKGRRPKMSVVLPAMNINDSIIRDQDHEVMMQIDCEVTDTRIINIRSSTIPPLLRVNRTETFYQHAATDNQAAPPVGVLVGSV